MPQNQLMAYIQGRRWSGNLRDFADDAKRGEVLPDATSWEQLECYLIEHHACEQAIEAGKRMWQCYEIESLKRAH